MRAKSPVLLPRLSAQNREPAATTDSTDRSAREPQKAFEIVRGESHADSCIAAAMVDINHGRRGVHIKSAGG